MFFHVTRCEYVEDILRDGLKVNQHLKWRKTFTGSHIEWAIDAYNMIWPIFISKDILWDKISSEIDDTYCVLQIDTSGLKIAADIPSLLDHHGYVDTEGETIWWEDGMEPMSMSNVLIDGEIDFHSLISDEEVISSAIQTTGTAAVLDNIPLQNITLVNMPSIKMAYDISNRIDLLKKLGPIRKNISFR